MANIDVVRKRPTTAWIWVIALVILAIVAFAFFALRGGPATLDSPVSKLLGPTLTPTTTVAV
jgi:hypothetical protein